MLKNLYQLLSKISIKHKRLTADELLSNDGEGLPSVVASWVLEMLALGGGEGGSSDIFSPNRFNFSPLKTGKAHSSLALLEP